MKKSILTNIFFSMLYEVIYAVSGIIVPKLLLTTFGSEVNGLVSSLMSFLNIFVVIEGGLKAVIAAKLYKPLVENDNKSFNVVVATGKSFYRKLAIYYIFFAVFLGILYPIIKQTSFSFEYIFFLVIIISAHSFVSYYSYVILSTILHADNRDYVVYVAYTIAAILNIVFVIIGINLLPSIHFVKILTFISYLVNPIILNLYIKKHYKIDKTISPNNDVLDQRWSGFSHNLSSFITNNIDIYVLSLFSTLTNVSIYSIYSIIITSIKQLVNTVSIILTPYLGKAKALNNKIDQTFNFQIFVNGIFITVVFSCTYVLINPFIKIYTANVTDANYINTAFAFMFVTSELISCISTPYINVTNATGDFRNTRYLAYTETIINAILSIILIFKFNLFGVIIATLIARIVRFILQIIYLFNNEKSIQINKALTKSFKVIIMTALIVFILNKIFIYSNIVTFGSWLIYGAASFVISSLLCLVLLYIFEHKYIVNIISIIK